MTIAGAWLCATAAAVGVSWLGVRTVVQDTVLPLPQVAVPAVAASSGRPPLPLSPPVASTPPPTTTTTVPPTTTTAPPTTTTKPPTTTPTSASAAVDADVQRFGVKGGQVVLDMTETEATLVSATPAEGYGVQVWQETDWLRVDFSSGNLTSTVIATWNGHAPTVQTYES
ncbi:MAG TPA: hypothetical protein VHW44_27580 [Pseudonocardiaceae bacterium]|jgi:hypothetical protein|nr:hypothetical protein [Pseudonocardiaceae bacterium]